MLPAVVLLASSATMSELDRARPVPTAEARPAVFRKPIRTQWFRDAKFGVQSGYLSDLRHCPANCTETTKAGWHRSCDKFGNNSLDFCPCTDCIKTADEWNAMVDAFDVDGLAKDLDDVGAGYLLIMVGENSGWYIAPNAAYDRIVGRNPSRLSKRDLIKDLGVALKRYGIRLLVYLPSQAPGRDLFAMGQLGLGNKTMGGSRGTYKMYEMFTGQAPGHRTVTSEGGYLWGTAPDGNRCVQFQRNWETIIREWSLRWGDLVHGWWFDGVYAPLEMYTFDTSPNFGSWAAAARAGNNASILTFSFGEIAWGQSITVESDYWDGDSRNEVLTINPSATNHQGYGQWNEQQHLVTYLGIGWSVETMDVNPRFTDKQVFDLTKKFNDGNWTVTWDVPMLDSGRLAPPIKQQLMKLRPLVEDSRPPFTPPTAIGAEQAAFPASDSLPMIEAKRQRTQWFYNATWGLWSHYLGRSAGQGCIQTCINGSNDWQHKVDSFNVTKTAEQLASVGAKYFFITIGQNSGYYISPNQAYEKVVGRAPNASRLSSRDLVSDLADALAAQKPAIRLLVYLPAGPPNKDAVAVNAFQWTDPDPNAASEKYTGGYTNGLMFGNGCFGKLSEAAEYATGGDNWSRSSSRLPDSDGQGKEHAQCNQMAIHHGFGNRSMPVDMHNCAIGNFPLPESPDPAVACRAACCANSACRSWGMDVKHPGNSEGCLAGKPCCWLERCSGVDAEHLTNCSWGCVSGQAGRADDPSQCGHCTAIACESCEAPPPDNKKKTVAPCKGGFDDEKGSAGYKTPYGLGPVSPNPKHSDWDGMRNAKATTLWSNVVREWSDRWGSKVSGWWFDGAYAPGEQFFYKDGPNFESLAEAAKSGNPESIVAFSNGIATNGWSWTPAADYFDGDTPQPLGFTPSGRRLGPTGEQHHMLSYLGVRWGNGSMPPRFSDSELAGFAKAAVDGEWVQTWDVPMEDDGSFPESFLAQIRRVLSGLSR
eukprot:COSAG02_NODE_3574_length_6538_cov_261.862137_2_plen_985_part_00